MSDSWSSMVTSHTHLATSLPWFGKQSYESSGRIIWGAPTKFCEVLLRVVHLSLFSQYLMSTYYVSGTVLGIEDTTGNQKSLCLHWSRFGYPVSKGLRTLHGTLDAWKSVDTWILHHSWTHLPLCWRVKTTLVMLVGAAHKSHRFQNSGVLGIQPVCLLVQPLPAIYSLVYSSDGCWMRWQALCKVTVRQLVD